MILGLVSLIIGILGLIAGYMFYKRSLYYGKISDDRTVKVVEKEASEFRKELEFIKSILQKIEKVAESQNLPNLKRDVVVSLRNIDDIDDKLLPFSGLGRIILFSKLYADDYKNEMEVLKKFDYLPKDKLDKFKKLLDETRLEGYMKSFPDLLQNLVVGMKISQKSSSNNI